MRLPFKRFSVAVLILFFTASARAFAADQDDVSGLTKQDNSIGDTRDQQHRSDPHLVLSELKFDTQEDLEESQRALQAALAFEPGNADYHFELSRVYGALYDDSAKNKKTENPLYLNSSQNELEQVLMIRPLDVPAHYNLGVIYKRRKKMEKARDEFRQVLKLSKQNQTESASPVVVSAWLQIGATYEDQGFLEDARDAYMKARELGGPRPEIQSAIEDLRTKEHDEGGRQARVPMDSWTRQYVGGAEYAQFGSEALKAQNQNAGVGALIPAVGQLLFQQFMDRREAKRNQEI